MQQQDHPRFPRPGWNQAAVWLGADFFGLVRLLMRNRFRVRPAYVPDCLLDVFISLVNTGFGGLQAFFCGSQVHQVQLQSDPIFIIGHWRTGTTLLHELLALDPRHRCPSTYECFSPNHFLMTESLVRKWLSFVLPGSRPTDNMEMGWDHPQEDEFALCNMGIPSPYGTMAFPNEPPQFPEYMDLERVSPQDRRLWKRGLLTFLQRLTYKRPGCLVLKSPTHTFRLPILLEMFPKARFIHMVRNPYVVFTSTIRLWKSLYTWQGYQKPNYEGLEEYVFRTFVQMNQRLDATRGLVDPSRFHEIRYEDMVQDPIGRMRAIYEQLDLGRFDLVEPAIRTYFDERKDYKTNRYELPPQLREEISRRWGTWIEKYGYGGKEGIGD